MEDEYKEIERKFYEIYSPLQKKYNLLYHMRFSIYDDGLIEIWEYDVKTEKRILRVKETEDIECYKRAIELLSNYKKEREAAEDHGRNTSMAG